MRRNFFFCVIVSTLILCGSILYPKQYKVAITQSATTATFSNFIRAIAEATDNTVDIQAVPRARAIYLIENKQVDIQAPSAESTDPAVMKDLKYDYSNVTYMKSCYVLYTNKGKNITADELKKGNPKKYSIETDTSLVNFFGFTANASTNLESSLKKVNDGTIDGYIYAQTVADVSLKKLGLKNIKRQLFSYSNLRFAIQKGAIGGESDKMLTDGFAKLKANGKFDQIMGAQVRQGLYADWQP